jgi:hypothetical protein
MIQVIHIAKRAWYWYVNWPMPIHDRITTWFDQHTTARDAIYRIGSIVALLEIIFFGWFTIKAIIPGTLIMSVQLLAAYGDTPGLGTALSLLPTLFVLACAGLFCQGVVFFLRMVIHGYVRHGPVYNGSSIREKRKEVT